MSMSLLGRVGITLDLYVAIGQGWNYSGPLSRYWAGLEPLWTTISLLGRVGTTLDHYLAIGQGWNHSGPLSRYWAGKAFIAVYVNM